MAINWNSIKKQAKRQEEDLKSFASRTTGMGAVNPASAFKPKDTATSTGLSGSLGTGKIGVDFAGLQRDRDTMAQDRQSIITERAQLTSRKVYNPETTVQNRERLAEIESQLGEIEARRDTLDYYEKYKDTQRDDNFLGQFQANYDVGRIQQEEAKAWNEYLDNPTQANREKAEALSTIMSDYVNRNTSALDEEGAVLPAVTRTLAQYLPQFVDQTKEQIKGGLAGGAAGAAVGSVVPGLGTAAGAVKGAKAGVIAATGVYSHDTMRGMAFKGLLDLGVDEETARAAANDEALISSLIEMADTGIDIATLGVGNLLNSLAKNGVKGAAKSLAVGAGVKAGIEKVTSTSLGKIATVLGRYGLNILSEGLEEYTQEAVSIANENRVSSGSKGGVLDLAGKAAGVTWDAATGKDPESAQRMNEAFAGGATIAAMMGGATMVGTTVTQRSLQKISDTSTGKDLKRTQENFELVDRGLTYEQDSKSYAMAQSIAQKLDASSDPLTAVTDAEYGQLYRAMREELDTKGPKTNEQRHDAVQAMHPEEKVITPTAQALIEAGDTPARADAKSVILDRVLAGDDTVTDSQLRKLDLQSPATRQVFTAFTGIQVPQTTDTKTLLTTFRSAITQAQEVQKLQATLEQQTMASVTALRQKAEEAAVAAEARAQIPAPIQAREIPAGAQVGMEEAMQSQAESVVLASLDKGRRSTGDLSAEARRNGGSTGQTAEALSALMDAGEVALDADNNLYHVDPALHIDNRTQADVGSRKVNAFQFDNPELHDYYVEAARGLLEDLDNTTRGERFYTEDGVTGVKRSTTSEIAGLLDDAGMRYADIRKAAEAIIANHGQENYAAAKRVELVLDGMLTDGWTDAMGRRVEPNADYIAAKGRLPGAAVQSGPGGASLLEGVDELPKAQPRKTDVGDVFRPKGETRAADVRATPDVQLSDGTSMTAQEFVNDYIATHKGATVQDANRVYSEAVRLNQTGMKFPAARKQESTAARSSVSPSSRKSRSEGKRTTAGKTASEGAVRADRSPSRVQRWTASYASALLKGSKIQGIDIAFDGFGEGERGYYLDGRIVLNGNTLTTQRAIMQVLGHELTHSAYDTDASIVDDILTTARRILGNDRVDRTMTETRERYIRFLTEQKGMSRDAAVAQMTPAAVKQEVAGDFMFDVFSDGALTRRLGKEAPSILTKARDMAARLLERLVGARGTDAAAARSELEWLMDRLDGALRANEAGDTMGARRSSVEDPVFQTEEKPIPYLSDEQEQQWEQRIRETTEKFGLSEDEADGISLYVNGSAYEWTSIQRGEDKFERTPFTDFFIGQTLSGLERMPTFQGRVYRNLRFTEESAYRAFLQEHQSGADVTLRAFTSASKDPNGYIALGDYAAHLVIDGVSGRDIADNFSGPGQREVIYLPGTVLHIDSVTTANDGHPLIYAKEREDNGENSEANRAGGRKGSYRADTEGFGRGEEATGIYEGVSPSGVGERRVQDDQPRPADAPGVPEQGVIGSTNQDEEQRFSVEPESTPGENAKKALDYSGRTYSWNETGYLTPDGKRLDFSGRRDGAPGGYRTVDHRDIRDALGDDYGGDTYSGGMTQFMTEGNIRISPESNGIDLSVRPTKAQESALRDFISLARGEVILDISTPDGDSVVSVEYPRGTQSAKIIGDIRNYFDDGVEPSIPETALYRYSVSSTQPFAEQVRTALAEDTAENRRTALYIRSTPSLLRELGLPDTAMAMTARHVKDINHAPGENLSWHGIPEEQIIRIPELLEQPAMVLESGTRPGDIVVVTTELDNEGRPIVLTVHPGGSALVDGYSTSANFITSMYGRNNFEKFLNAVVRNGGVLYWDKNRSQDLLTSARVQFPAGMRDLASGSIIRKIGGSVNENRSRTLPSLARVQFPASLTASASDTTISQPGTDVNGESVPGTPRFSINGKPLADPLYSQMENVILDFKGEKIGAQSLISYLKGHGVKDEEIKWSGITGFLEGKKSIPKQELVDFLRANELVIEDTVLGNGYDQKTQAKLDAQEEQLDELVSSMREKAAVIFPDEDPTDWSPYQLTNALRDRFLNSEIDASNQEMTDVLTEAFKLSSEYDTLKRRHERDIETALNAIDPVYEEYKLDGGENYREILFRLPNAEDTPHSPHWEQDDTLAHTRLQDFVDAEGKKVLFVEEVQSDWHQEGREHGYTTEAVDSETFMDRSPEYQEALDNAVNANTKFYEELQRSEFAYLMDEDYADDFDLAVEVERVARQEGLPKDNPLRVAAKKYLLASERATTLEDTLLWTWRREVANRVPDAPYRTTWHEYVMKRILRMAAENGYDKVAWTTGKMQSDRYGLQKQIGGIEVYSNGQEGGSYRVEVSSPSGRPMQGLSGVYSPDKLTRTFGKDLGRRMMEGADASPENGYSISGEGLSIGGEGMHNFYDVGGRSAQNLPKFLNKYLKPWGVKVETSLIGRDLRNTSAYRSGGMNEVMRIAKTQDQSQAPYLVPSVDITPEMRDDLLYKGQPRFSVQEGNVNPDTGYETGSVADSVMRMINAGDVDEALKMMGDVLKQFQQIEADQVNRKKQASAAAAFRPKQSLTDDLIAKNKKAIEELVEKYGSMEQTSAAQRTVLLPKAIDKETKVRGVMQTAAATENTPEYLLSEIERSILDGDEGATYVSIGDKGSLKRAENLLKDKGFETLLHEWRAKIDAGVRLDKTDIVMAEKLYVEAANNKDTATAMQLLSEIAMAGTQSGQIVQAMTMLKNMTPSGQLYYLQKTVDRFNTEHKDLRLLGKEIAIDPGLARKLLEAKTQEEIDTAMGDLIQNIADQLPVTLLDRWNAWRYLAMLGNPRTHIRNLFGNAIFTPARLAKDVLATAGERLLQSRGIITQEERTKAFSTKETRDFAKADSVGMERILRGGGKQNIADQIRDARKIFGDTPIEWLSRKNSELLEWEDWIFLRSAYEHALAGFLSARKADVSTLSGADSTREGRALLNEARAYAVREAQKATYRDVSKLASMLSHLKRTGGPAAQIFLDGLIPFTKTPINIVKRGVEYSPVGLLKSITVDLNRVRKGEISATEAVDNICAGLTGTGIVAMGYVLAKMGILVGGFGDEPEDEFQELQGEQSYSLRLGDVSYTIDWTAPVALPLFVGAEIDRLSAGEFSAGDLPDAIATLLEPVLSLSMLDGLNSTLASVRYDSADQALVNILKTVGGSYLTQGVPTLAGQIARTMDDSRRTSFTPTGMGSLQSWASRTYQTSVLGKIPVASEQRMLYIDAWGRSDTQPNVALRALENFLSPGYANTIQTTSVDRELIRLAEETKDTGVFPKRATKYFTVGGEQYAMTQEEYEAHLIERGQTSYRLVSDLTSSPDYAKLPDTAKVQAVQAAYTYASELAKYHTNSGYDADSWVLRLRAAEDELNLDPSDYFIAKALSKQNGSSLREAALGAGFDPATTASVIAADFSAQGSFTDPYTPKHEYVLNSEQKERYESMFREKFVSAYTDYGLGQLTGAELSDEVSDLVSEINAEVKREMSDWLYGQGISPTPKN